jgi:hypothetical protein
MTKMEYAQRLKSVLTNEGFETSIDEDNDLQFKIEGETFVVMPTDDDNMFFQMYYLVSLPYNPKSQRSKALSICNDINFEYKAVKFLAGKARVFAKIELLTLEQESMPLVIKRSAKILIEAARDFKSRLKPSESHD